MSDLNKSIKNNPNDAQIIRSVAIELGILPLGHLDKYQRLTHADPRDHNESIEALDHTINFLQFCTLVALSEAIQEIALLCGRKKLASGSGLSADDYRLGTAALMFKCKKLRQHYDAIYRLNSENLRGWLKVKSKMF